MKYEIQTISVKSYIVWSIAVLMTYLMLAYTLKSNIAVEIWLFLLPIILVINHKIIKKRLEKRQIIDLSSVYKIQIGEQLIAYEDINAYYQSSQRTRKWPLWEQLSIQYGKNSRLSVESWAIGKEAAKSRWVQLEILDRIEELSPDAKSLNYQEYFGNGKKLLYLFAVFVSIPILWLNIYIIINLAEVSLSEFARMIFPNLLYISFLSFVLRK